LHKKPVVRWQHQEQKTMSKLFRDFAPFLLLSVLTIGCGPQARVYNPSFRALAEENAYYRQWERETHQDHVEFDKRSDADKRAYWYWRHTHSRQ
jgi:hypothetical protein